MKLCDDMKAYELNQLPQLAVDYIHYLNAVKNKSPLTVLEYASDLRTFFRYLYLQRGLVNPAVTFEEVDVSGANLEFIRSISLYEAYGFLSYCRSERDNESAARARKVSAIRLFFRFLNVQAKVLDENPMQELEAPQLKKVLPKYLSLDESVSLLDSVDGKHMHRDYCIITFFLNCGLRLSELVSLNCSNINNGNQLRVIGKGNKERILYLNSACVAALERYLAVRPHDAVKDKDALFLSGRNQRISPKTVQYIVKHFLEKSGLADKGYSVHKLRHTAATLLYQHGNVDVLLLKEMLGHENLSTTQIYTHVSNEQLRSAMEDNPLSNIKSKKKTEDALSKNEETNEGTV